MMVTGGGMVASGTSRNGLNNFGDIAENQFNPDGKLE
jgi:hypothetical protein